MKLRNFLLIALLVLFTVPAALAANVNVFSNWVGNEDIQHLMVNPCSGIEHFTVEAITDSNVGMDFTIELLDNNNRRVLVYDQGNNYFRVRGADNTYQSRGP